MNDNCYKVQIDPCIYRSKDYMSEGRWLAFREQVVTITNIEGTKTVAEIGKGNGIVSNILSTLDYDVTTIDFDEALKPDIVCSVLDLKEKVSRGFDVVLCAEVLEHLKFEDFEEALRNLATIAKHYVVLSLPYVGYTAKFVLYASKYGERKLEFVKRIPMFWAKHVFRGGHYWEVGKRGFSLNKAQKIIEMVFIVKRRWLLPYNHSQVFFLLEAK